MTEAWRPLGRAMAVVLVVGAIAAVPGSAQDAGTGTLTIYGAVCPIDYAGDRFVEDCAATPAVGASYQARSIATGESRPPGGGFATADDTGIVAFENLSGLAPGTIQILAMASDDLAIPGGYTVPAVACTAADDRTVDVTLLDSGFTGRIVELEAQAGDDLRCDIYFVPLSLAESGDPASGRPAAVYAGDCPDGGDAPGALVAELTALAAPAGETVGQVAAVVAETSFSVIPLSLQELLAERQVIGVGAPERDASSLVVCGEIGGVVNEAGSLVLGLREVGDSSFTGIAFLTPSAADPARTDISLFVAAGLADEDAAAVGAPTVWSVEPMPGPDDQISRAIALPDGERLIAETDAGVITVSRSS